MMFRPLPVLSLFTLPLFLGLIWLGVWQLQRAEWKADLVETYAELANRPPSRAASVLCEGPAVPGLAIAPVEAGSRTLRVFGHDLAGAPGWRLFSPVFVCGPDKDPVLTESGFEPLALGGEIVSQASGQTGAPARLISDPWPSKPLMAAQNAPDRNEWYWFDPAPMADALGLASVRTDIVLLAASQTPDFLVRTPPVRHVGYAVTWFGMALALIAFYLVFHIRAGRLKLSRDGKNER